MKIPLIDLVAQFRSIREEIDHTIRGVLESGTSILVPNVTAFEQEVAAYLGVRFAAGVAPGTDSLLLTIACIAIVLLNRFSCIRGHTRTRCLRFSLKSSN